MDTPCIPYSGYLNPKGYGKHSVGGVSDWAHRHSYRKHNGPIPKGKIVRHTCDNPSCIEPSHLILGTQLDNMQDAKTRGRLSNKVGANNDRSKLTESEVRAIKRALLAPYIGIVNDLAAEYKASPQTISNIKTGRAWTSVSLE